MRIVFFTFVLLFGSVLFSQSVNVATIFPEEGSYLQQDDCFIALSFLDSASSPIESAVLENSIKLTINEIPVAAESITIENGVAVFRNISFMEGLQKLKIEILDNNGNVLGKAAMNFTIIPPEEEKKVEKQKRFKQNGRVFTSATHNALAGKAFYDLDLGAAYRARYNKWHTSADLYITSKESEKDQPRNIYTVGFGYGKNFELKLGDVAPSLNALSINGQRIRGIELNTALYSKIGNRIFSLDAAYGEAVRAVAPYEIAGNDSVFGKGTFARNLLCARLATGAGEAFQFGLLFIKGRDDTSSIRKVGKDTLEGSAYFASEKPKDNVVIGADMSSVFFKERIELFGTYALSLYSRDITHGMLTKAELEKALDSAELPFDPSSLGSFLIFNTSTTPISPYGEGILNSSALEGGVRLRFSGKTFSQNLEVKYQDIGPNYYSVAAPLLGFSRTGIVITEQLALFENHISLNSSYENFVNGAGSGLSQTKENGLNLGLSLWHSATLPTFTVGYNSSGVSNTDDKFGFNNSVGMLNVSSQYGFTTPNGYVHNLQLYTAHTGIKNGWNNIVFEQDSGGTGFHVGDSVSDTSLSVSTQLYSLAWSMALPEQPLTFNGSFMGNSGSRDFVRVLSWSGGANYILIPGKLTVSSQLAFSSLHRPTESETRSQLRFKYGTSYRPTVNHTLRFDGSTLNGTGKPDFRNHFYYEFRF